MDEIISHTKIHIPVKADVNLRFLPPKIAEKNGKLKMLINNKKQADKLSRKTTKQVVHSFLLGGKQKFSNLGKTVFNITIPAIS